MSKIKLGVVGCGGIFQWGHLPALLSLSDEIEIVALYDSVTEKMDIEGVPATAKKYNSYHDLIKDENVDAVAICTPNYLHSVVAIEALNNGKHVLTEKPDAISVDEMQKMIDAENKSGKILMAVRNSRHYDVSRFFKSYIDEGNCGEIYSGKCLYLRRRGIPGGWFTMKALSGGGPIIDVGIHVLDLAIYLMGNPKAVSVSGCTFNKFSEVITGNSKGGTFDVEDSAMGFIRFENGSCLQLEFCWAGNVEKEECSLELRGAKSGIRYSSDDDKNVIWGEQNGALVDTKINLKKKATHDRVYRNFIDVINGKDKPDYTTEQGMNIIKIIEGFYESAKLGKEIIL